MDKTQFQEFKLEEYKFYFLPISVIDGIQLFSSSFSSILEVNQQIYNLIEKTLDTEKITDILSSFEKDEESQNFAKEFINDLSIILKNALTQENLIILIDAVIKYKFSYRDNTPLSTSKIIDSEPAFNEFFQDKKHLIFIFLVYFILYVISPFLPKKKALAEQIKKITACF